MDDTLELPSSTHDTSSIDLSIHKVKSCSDDDNSSAKTGTLESNTETKPSPLENENEAQIISERTQEDLTNTSINELQNETLVADEEQTLFIRLQLENQELLNWKNQLQARITAERSEIVRLKKLLAEIPSAQNENQNIHMDETDFERLTAHYIKENSLLEQKKNLLARDLFEENRALIQLQVELALQKYKS